MQKPYKVGFLYSNILFQYNKHKTHDVNVKNVFYATVLYFMTQVLQFLFVLVTLLLSILKITQYSYTQKLDMIQLNAGKYN